MEDLKALQVKCNCLCREELYHTLIGLVEKSADTSNNLVKFYLAFSLMKTYKVEDALAILTPLQADPVINLAAILAGIYIHKHLKIGSDSDSVSRLESLLRNERKKANDKSLYFAALFLHFNNRQEKAREYADRMLSVNPGPNNVDGLILKGWIELCSVERTKRKNPLDYFNPVLALDNQLVEAHQGKIRALVQAGNMSEALSTVNHIISTFPKEQIFLLEKLRINLAEKDWDAVTEFTKKINTLQNPLIIKIFEIQILATICHDGSFVDATPLLKRLFAFVEKYEPNNGELFINVARLFSRVCGRHIPILNECLTFVERALRKDEKNVYFLMELTRQQMLQGRLQEALASLKTISQLGEASIEAMLLKIRCFAEDEQYEAAQQQMTIVEELHDNATSRPEWCLIKAILSRNKQPQEAIALLRQAYQLQVKNAACLPYGVDYLIQLNPDFLLSVAEEYFQHGPEDSPQTLTELTDILSNVVEACPGLLPALYRLANAQLMVGDYRTASATLHHIIDHVDPTYIDAYLLMAQIGIDQNNVPQAAQYLEMGLSYNFQVRDHPKYHLLLSRVQRLRKENEAALGSLRLAMMLSGMRPSSAGSKRTKHPFTPAEKTATYLELFYVMTAAGQKEDAGQVIQEALAELKGTSQEGLILLAQVDYLLNEDDIDGALLKLKSLPVSHPQYIKAREKMADIYLHKLQDESLYLQCYRDIVQYQPTVRNLTLLGDAHLALHQVDLAVAAYEEALKMEPRHSLLAGKIGSALILTHQYTKALNYYKDALRDSTQTNSFLRTEYASLLIRLGQYDKAEKIITEFLSSSGQQVNKDSSEKSMDQVRLLLLLAKLHEKNGNEEAFVGALSRAQSIITSLLKRITQQDQTDEKLAEQKKIASAISVQMGAHALSSERDMEAAIRYYREALSYSPDDTHILAQLAKVYLLADDVEHCQHMCKSLLKIDRENDQATMMIAQIALRKNELETATLHFKQALERHPNHYDMLGQFVDVCRRRGTIADALPSLKAAENNSVNGINDAGLSYCRGLYEYYSGQSNTALLSLNQARGHTIWGQYAIRVMLDICLNGESDTLETPDLDSTYEVQDTELMALHTAAKLLQELQPVDDDALQTHALYPNFYLLATRQKANVERAISELTTFATKSNQQDNPGVVYGLATAHVLLKQTQKAKNHLKRLIKSTWTLEEGEYLEKCWLMLSDIYIQQSGQNKIDSANDMLRRVLTYNRSCAKAYEYLGYILEKDQSYREAANHFENAWKLTNQNSGVVGFKLAHSYLKAKQYTDAIDISQAVLDKYPDHPRIRKDVLDKAISNLRS